MKFGKIFVGIFIINLAFISVYGRAKKQQSKVKLMKLDEIKRKFADGKIPLPDCWGGFRIKPKRFEFWQGRPNRLHDRFLYSKIDDESWEIERLAP